MRFIACIFPLKKTRNGYAYELENALSNAKLKEQLVRRRSPLLYDQPRLDVHVQLIDGFYEGSIRETKQGNQL